jgi:hypothetical protein
MEDYNDGQELMIVQRRRVFQKNDKKACYYAAWFATDY